MQAVILSFLLFVLRTIALRVPSHDKVPRTPSHSYTSPYTLDRRDGWESVSVSNLGSKYSHINSTEDGSSAPHGPPRSEKRARKHNNSGGISGAINTVVDTTLKGIGKIEQVTITWYTGNDLKNPSCWNKIDWAPSDNSLVCAVTLEGWVDRPGCFKFLEICNGIKKCIFVRVVDTCAGCAKGSKHVDLTKAGFGALATLDVGTLQVQMRLATEPQEWDVSLWGPKHA